MHAPTARQHIIGRKFWARGPRTGGPSPRRRPSLAACLVATITRAIAGDRRASCVHGSLVLRACACVFACARIGVGTRRNSGRRVWDTKKPAKNSGLRVRVLPLSATATRARGRRDMKEILGTGPRVGRVGRTVAPACPEFSSTKGPGQSWGKHRSYRGRTVCWDWSGPGLCEVGENP